jgi:20S proteasome alpha/beta subunit
MTLLVGIRCTDGVVVAADSAVTFGNSQFHTVSDSVCKIQVIDKRLSRPWSAIR